MRHIHTIIYDFDGTLADTFQIHLDAYSKSLEMFGITSTKEEIIQKCFNKTDVAAAKNFGIDDVASFNSYYRNAFLERLYSVNLYEGALETLQALQDKSINMAIGTMRTKDEMEIVFKHLPIQKFFKIIVTSKNISHVNPKYEIFKIICTQLNSAYNETLIVGDSTNDMNASRELGIQGVLFYPDSHRDFYELSHFNPKPEIIISDHGQIIKYV